MNVYEKLNQARIDFQSAGVKKSGQNKFAGYTYYELSDILPVINKSAEKLKFACVVDFTSDIATLSFVDIEKPEDKVVFSSPMSQASLKGCHDVQNLGAVQTYLKRYLYQNCFEIVESDYFDSTTGKFEYMVELVNKAITEGKFNESQIDYVNKCIAKKSVERLEEVVNKLTSGEMNKPEPVASVQ